MDGLEGVSRNKPTTGKFQLSLPLSAKRAIRKETIAIAFYKHQRATQHEYRHGNENQPFPAPFHEGGDHLHGLGSRLV
jgi:hypothetical protein